MLRNRAADVLRPSGFFVLRAPLLPFDALESWSSGLEAPAAAADGGHLEHALLADRRRLRARLSALIARADVGEALFLASPSLDAALGRWRQDADSAAGRRAERAAIRYIARMAGRATPFGLFAGCAVGPLGDATRLAVGDPAAFRRHTRLDTDYLWTLVQTLRRDPGSFGGLALRPNSSLHALGDRIRYVEGRTKEEGRRYSLVAVHRTAEIERVLACAVEGASASTLASSLGDADVSPDECASFVDALRDAQVLVDDLDIAVTDVDPLADLCERLISVRDAPTERRVTLNGGATRTTAAAAEWAITAESVADILSAVRTELAALDRGGVGQPTARYRSIADALEALPAPVTPARLFQVDLELGAGATLGEAVAEEILRAADLLNRMTPADRADDPLSDFRERFEARYGCRAVPLLEALDEEAGIGYGTGADPSPLLRDFPDRTPQPASFEWSERAAARLDLLAVALAAGKLEIALDDETIDRLTEPEAPPLPDAFAVTASLAAESEGAIARGRFRLHVESVHGSSGAQLLGRFCHADPTLRSLVEAHLRAEEALHPDRVFAEIVHLPEGRTGNILLRPVLRAYEIPFLGRSGASADRQIPPSDLHVSVRDGEIVLRSARLDRRVMPRLTTAHNHTNGLGVYRFLCALQHQGQRPAVGWAWGPLASAPFLPRVTAGRVVLARARWRVRRLELQRLSSAATPDGYRSVMAWREERRLPRWVVLVEGDNLLPLDLDNVLVLESFAHMVKDRAEIVLEELFPAPDELVARGTDGRYVHELIVPFVRSRPVGPATPPVAVVEAAAPSPPSRVVERRTPYEPGIRRSFPPGSEWSYIKLYTGTATADQVLREVIAPVVREALSTGAADRWFFIRYADPDCHLRIRFRAPDTDASSETFRRIGAGLEPFLADGRIHRVALDTYEREVDRYGGPRGIELAETVFHADSDAVLEALASLDHGEAGPDARWQICLVGMHRLLDDLRLDTDQRIALLHGARDGTARMLRVAPGSPRRLGERFRALRTGVEPLLDLTPEADHPLADAAAAFRCRSSRIAHMIDRSDGPEPQSLRLATLQSTAASLLHMHVNRTMRSAPNEHELLLYDMLARLYTSRRERSRT
jgi:lantibiotic biosynthesis protein